MNVKESKMIRIYLVRHGENVANITKEFSHRLVDYDLTDKGRLQASQTADYFRSLSKNVSIGAIYSSPLKRAMQTADAISAAVGVPYTVVEDFREINVGDLEKHPPTDESWDTYFRVSDAWYNRRMEVPFPGGEDYDSLYGRFIRGLQLVIGSGAENIIIVGHAGIFTFGIMELFHIDDRHAFDAIPNCNCSVTEILLDDEAKPIELVRWADGSHLSGEAAKIVASYPVREVGENVKERIK